MEKDERLNSLDEESERIEKRMEKIKEDSISYRDTTAQIAQNLGTISAVITGAASALLLVRETCGSYDPNSPEMVDRIYNLTKELHAKAEQIKNLRKQKADPKTLEEVMRDYSKLQDEIRELNKTDTKLRRKAAEALHEGRFKWHTTAAYIALIGSVVFLITLAFRYINHHLTLIQRYYQTRQEESRDH